MVLYAVHRIYFCTYRFPVDFPRGIFTKIFLTAVDLKRSFHTIKLFKKSKGKHMSTFINSSPHFCLCFLNKHFVYVGQAVSRSLKTQKNSLQMRKLWKSISYFHKLFAFFQINSFPEKTTFQFYFPKFLYNKQGVIKNDLQKTVTIKVNKLLVWEKSAKVYRFS